MTRKRMMLLNEPKERTRERARRLYDSGVSAQRIAKYLELPESAVRRMLR